METITNEEGLQLCPYCKIPLEYDGIWYYDKVSPHFICPNMGTGCKNPFGGGWVGDLKEFNAHMRALKGVS